MQERFLARQVLRLVKTKTLEFSKYGEGQKEKHTKSNRMEAWILVDMKRVFRLIRPLVEHVQYICPHLHHT